MSLLGWWRRRKYERALCNLFGVPKLGYLGVPVVLSTLDDFNKAFKVLGYPKPMLSTFENSAGFWVKILLPRKVPTAPIASCVPMNVRLCWVFNRRRYWRERLSRWWKGK